MAASYWQIVTTLREEIVSGLYTAAVPPGADLAGRFGVSESTINRALSQLRSEGLVRTQQGRGTTVNPVPVIRRDAAARQRTGARESGGSRGAFDAELRAAGLDPHTEVEVGRAVPAGSSPGCWTSLKEPRLSTASAACSPATGRSSWRHHGFPPRSLMAPRSPNQTPDPAGSTRDSPTSGAPPTSSLRKSASGSLMTMRSPR